MVKQIPSSPPISFQNFQHLLTVVTETACPHVSCMIHVTWPALVWSINGSSQLPPQGWSWLLVHHYRVQHQCFPGPVCPVPVLPSHTRDAQPLLPSDQVLHHKVGDIPFFLARSVSMIFIAINSCWCSEECLNSTFGGPELQNMAAMQAVITCFSWFVAYSPRLI